MRSFVATTIIVLSVASAAFANQLPRGFAEQYMRTLKQVIQADHEAYDQMQLVAKKLEQFYIRFGHFPDSDSERAAFRQLLGSYISYNAYRPEITDHLEHTTSLAPYAVPVFWMKDEGLEKDDFLRFLKKPDPSWQGEPGTIFILTNGRNIFLVWTASADRLPMRLLTTAEQTPRMICREILQQ